MQTLRKKTSPLKYRNEPARFFGDGVVFKAKLIGILEVGEARGDRMCQEALQDLKIAIRAAGEHKQRITIHVTIEGLRLRDEKTGESLYHHPVHKISFIAQDMTDSRAFGYIFGSPDCGHRFFGIKTDKAASQVVLAMRDLFQCVFELKKKEIELAKQHIQNRITAHEHQQIKSSILEHKKTSSLSNEAKSLSMSSTSKPEKSPETTANLVDLEQELSSIQRGITQMERITPNDDAPTKNVLDDDPFGDSFASFSSTSTNTPFNILPPPSATTKRNLQQKHSGDDDPMRDFSSSIIGKSSSSITPPISQSQPPPQQQSSSIDSWLTNTTTTSSSIFKDNNDSTKFDDLSKLNNNKSFDDDSNNANLNTTKSELIDAFTDLDPLGTGKSKPYVDKKYFFQDLKNPPKKVLKDLSERETIFDAHFSPQKRSVGLHGFSLDSSSLLNSQQDNSSSSLPPVIDPFEEEDFSKINIDQLEPPGKSISPNQKSIILPDTKISSSASSAVTAEDKPKSEDKFNDYKSYSADLPSESWTSPGYSDLKRQSSDGSTKNVFSVDSFSKKLPKPNLFGQRNVKRDSNGINMRRLQESDSLSENEPELPPRLPDSSSHEPPPLPPKNQRDSSSEYDRNRYSRTPTSRDSNSRYDYANKFKSLSSDSPPIPLPSRKINRTETSISSKSSKKSNEDEDYLTPNPSQNTDSFPTLPPPPPQKNPSKSRGPRKSDTDPKNLDAPTPPISAKLDISSSLIPDITLSQLLTLGIDDLAQKLNVPASKLNTMTLVELTTYLSDFIEKSKQSTNVLMPVQSLPHPLTLTYSHPTSLQYQNPISNSIDTPSDSPVFKVSFDDAVFEAKFDDNFGELNQQQQSQSNDSSFVANFENFNQPPISVIPTADRYAVFREIIDQDIQQQQSFEEKHQESVESNSLEEVQESPFDFARGFGTTQFGDSPIDKEFKQSPITTQTSKIDNKISEALSGVRGDRYAALRELRNIVLVEDLFDKSPKPPLASISDSNLSDDLGDDGSSFNQQVFETAEVADNNSLDNLPTYSVSWADAEDENDEVNSDGVENQDQEQLQQPQKSNLFGIVGNKDDLEIDEYMNKAISELSLDNRLSPNIQCKSPLKLDDEKQTSSPLPMEFKKISPSLSEIPTVAASSPISSITDSKPDINAKDELDEFEMKQNVKFQKKEETFENGLPENKVDNNDDLREKTITPSDVKPVELDSWAVFEQEETLKAEANKVKGDHQQESGSSDGKNQDWKQREKEYSKRWPKPHTSSSSRDVSPWEDGPPSAVGSEQRKRPPHVHSSAPAHYPPPTDRYARPPAPRRRINSHEEEYDEEYERRPPSSRMRASKPPIHRSKEILESENPNWYHPTEHWYPDEEDDEERMERTPRPPPFDRNAYERSTYGPPYDKRYQGYDRRAYEKRSKYYRSYRPDYDYDPYDGPLPPPSIRGKPPRKDYDDFEGNFERGTRETRSAREYFYDRDRRSFDSNESYDSTGRMHRMNSGEIYGSHESGRNDYRDRYVAQQGGRISRRTQRSRGAIDDDDSDDAHAVRRPSGETSGGSLQRGQGARSKHSNIRLDDEVWGSGKYWKQRPASATAVDKMSGSGGLSGSDNERERRHRRKTRQSRGKEVELRSNYATIRYGGQQQQQQQQPPLPPRREYYDFDDDLDDYVDEPSPSNASPRPQGVEPRDYYARKKHSAGNIRTSTTPRMENRSFSEYVKPRYTVPPYDDQEDEKFAADEGRMHVRGQNFKKSTSKDVFNDDAKDHFVPKQPNTFDDEALPKRQMRRNEFSSEEQQQPQQQQQQQPQQQQQQQQSNQQLGNNKFSFDGFESDFTSSPKQQMEQKSEAHKFTFEEREFTISPSTSSTKNGTSQQKLRFNENVSISKFDKNAASSAQQMFEDDFLQSWTPETTTPVSSSGNNVQMQSSLKKTSAKGNSRQENIKKSDSINIFARKNDEDPFANDDFFNDGEEEEGGGGGKDEQQEDPFQWNKNNFANFDDNKNI